MHLSASVWDGRLRVRNFIHARRCFPNDFCHHIGDHRSYLDLIQNNGMGVYAGKGQTGLQLDHLVSPVKGSWRREPTPGKNSEPATRALRRPCPLPEFILIRLSPQRQRLAVYARHGTDDVISAPTGYEWQRKVPVVE